MSWERVSNEIIQGNKNRIYFLIRFQFIKTCMLFSYVKFTQNTFHMSDKIWKNKTWSILAVSFEEYSKILGSVKKTPYFMGL